MSLRSKNMNRVLQFQGLEARQLLAADLGFGVSKIASVSFQESTSKTEAAQVATMSTQATAVSVEEVVDAELRIDELLDRDAPEVMDQAHAESEAGMPPPEQGLPGFESEILAYDRVQALEGTDKGPLSGEMPEISTGYQANLDGANAQVPGAHPNTQPGKGSASQKVLDAYQQGGLDTSGKTPFQMEHACVSIKPDAYKRTDQQGENYEYNSGSLLNSSSSAAKKEEAKKEETNSGTNNNNNNSNSNEDDPEQPEEGVGGGGDAEDEAAGEDSSGDGDAGETPPTDPPEASQPDYGEGYVDPNDPLNQVWSEFTEAYLWMNFEADQNADVTPNPMQDTTASTGEGPTTDYLDWIDGGHLVIDTDVPDWAIEAVQNYDDGTTDPPEE